MSDTATNVASDTGSGQQAAMKSTDTSAIKPAIEAAAEAAKPAKAEPAKPAQRAEPEPDHSEGEQQDDAGNGDNATSADAPAEGKRKDRLPRWVQERMERVRVQERAETEARVRAEYAQREAPRQQQAQTNVQATAEQPRTLADFNFDMGAYTAHLVEQEVTRREQAQRDAEAERSRNEAVEQFKTKIDAFESRVGAGAWEDIETSPINTDAAFADMTALFMGSDHDLEIALHLANNLTEARRINALPPLQRAREVAKLADLFSGETQETPAPPAKPAPPPKRVTSAPPPPKTLSATGKSAVNADDPNISTADRIAAWKAQGVGKRR